MFGLVEEFILPYVVDHARPQLSGDDYRVRVLLQFAGEEAKHIHLFKRQLDLRGFLGLDPNLKAGYESLQYVVRIAGNGTPEQFREIHENVIKTSPNYFNVSRPVRLDATLKVES
ncbi:MAG: hypothetical protein WD688_13860 [Candidatus Binatia bacterium]